MMDLKQKTLDFLKSIEIENFDDFDIEFTNVIRSTIDKNFFTFEIKKETGWDFRTLDQFLNGLNLIKSYKYSLIFKYEEDIKNEKLINLIKDWYFNFTHENTDFDVVLSKGDNSEIKLTVSNSEDEEKINSVIPDLLCLFNTINYPFKLSCYNLEVKKEQINEDEITQTNKEEVFEEVKKATEEELTKVCKENYELMMDERRQHDLFKKGDYQPFKICQLDSNSGPVDINGTVFEVTSRETKKGKLSFKVGLQDESDAIYINFYSNETSLKREDLLRIVPNTNLRVKGRVNVDTYNRGQLTILGHYFYELPPTPLREDTSEEKRVELHLHTKMSEMDGVSFFKDYVKLAKHMGHKAIAITDHGNVQGFPDAQAVCKKNGIKGLFGSELYVIDDFLHGSLNANGTKLNKATYVCLDTETTGLSIKYDRITEFGAVKVVNGVVTEKLDILINPGMPIPLAIQEKTNITDEMVKDKPFIKDVLPTILEFLKDSIMVTHNLEFDYGMINQAMIDNGFGPLKMEAIDTLPLSRYLFSESAYHNLGSLARRYEVDYDEDSAHRADYDAEVLSNVWLMMRQDLERQNPNVTTKDIENLPLDKKILAHYRNVYHAIVIAKNYAGVKELYQITSDSHVNEIGNFPFTTKSFLNSHRSNLFVGSACFNGEVFQAAMIRDDVALRKAIKQFDYIELQPLDNYCYLIYNGTISNEDRLKEIIRNIVKIAKEENKMIVATGDCHYVNPSDKIYRDIIISAAQVGGKVHPLNNNPRDSFTIKQYRHPDQHFRSTDEMLDCFKWLGEDDSYQFVITNTNKIADQIEELVPVKLDTYYPQIDGAAKLLTDLVYETAHKLYGDELHPIIQERLTKELDGIINNGYSSLYWIAHLLVKHSNEDGYIVGSRGSVGSSLVATMSNITEVNPLPPHYRCPKCRHTEFYEEDVQMSGFDLPEKRCPICGEKMIGDGQSIPFQTFLGFHVDKTPDIDLNFATNYQATAHNYTKVLLGANNVYRAGTISAVQFKTAYGYVSNYFTYTVYQDQMKEIYDRVAAKNEGLPQKDIEKLAKDEQKVLLDKLVKPAYRAALGYGCIEVKRTTGQHPAGIVVLPEGYDIEDFTPVQYPADDINSPWRTTHFDFTSMHDTLLKLDILGHLDPQSIKMMCDLTHLDVHSIPVNDPDVLSLFTSDDALNLSHRHLPVDNGATGLPEFGTDFVRQVLRESQPHTFRDLVIISGLTHGTNVWNNNARDLILNEKKTLKDVIGCRDDIMVYLINMGLDPSNAFTIMETVRKKDKQLKSEQIQDMLEHNVPEFYINSCKKIEYLFPKGHATAYVMMALRVGYFKVHYPLEYYATFFSLRSDEYSIAEMVEGEEAIYEKLQELYKLRALNNSSLFKEKDKEIVLTLEVALEMYERGFKFVNIDIEKSAASEFIIDYENKALIPPFSTLNGVGLANSESLVKARTEKMFTSKEDFAKRSGFTQTNIKQLEKLHCLDFLRDKEADVESISLFDFNF